MKTLWRVGAILLVLALTAFLVSYIVTSQQRQPIIREPAPEAKSQPNTPALASNQPPPASTSVNRARRGELTPEQLAMLRTEFDGKLKPALEKWSTAYHGHLPFDPANLTSDKFLEQMGRGNYCQYVFMVDGVTVGVDDANGDARVSYMATKAAKKLADSPKGERPNIPPPVSRDELMRMLRLDSGSNFAPAEVRIVPSALSSAVNGGMNVSVGGDAVNIASWKFTLSFGSDASMNYYCRSDR